MLKKENPFWTKLTEAGLIEEATTNTPSASSPWYVKCLLAISGWLGACFLLGFLFLAISLLVESPEASFFASIFMLLGARQILHTLNNEFYEHFALAISLSAQALFIRWIIDWDSFALMWLTIGGFQTLLAFVMPSFLHRMFSTIFASFSFSVSLNMFGMPNILGSLFIALAAWLCLNEFKYVNHYPRIKGIMYGIVVSLLLLKSSHLFGTGFETLFKSPSEKIMQLPVWVSSLLYIAALLFTCWQLLVSNKAICKPKLVGLAFFFTIIIGIATFKAPGFGAGLAVLLLGFAHSNRILCGLGIITLLAYSSAYYYLMSETLLFKSGILLLIALLMLGSRFLSAKTLQLLKD